MIAAESFELKYIRPRADAKLDFDGERSRSERWLERRQTGWVRAWTW